MGNKNNIKQRVSAVIIENDKILLIRRVKPGIEYYTLPDGTVEKGENIKHAMRREIKEELSVDAKIERLLFEIESDSRKDYYFLIGEWIGLPKLGGPEAERMNINNQYHLEWIDRKNFKRMNNFYPGPQNAREKLITMWERQEI